MKTASGTLNFNSGVLTAQSSGALGFDPQFVLFQVKPNPTVTGWSANNGAGFCVSNSAGGQQAYSMSNQGGGVGTSACNDNERDQAAIVMSTSGGVRWEADCVLGTDEFQLDPSRADIGATVDWLAIDGADMRFGAHRGAVGGSVPEDITFIRDGTPFTATHFLTQGAADITNGSVASSTHFVLPFVLTDLAKAVGGVVIGRSAEQSSKLHSVAFNTDDPGYAGEFHSWVQTNTGNNAISSSASYAPNGDDTVTVSPVNPGNMDPYMLALAAANNGDLAILEGAAPAAPGTQSFTGLGFEPKAIIGCLFLGVTSKTLGSTTTRQDSGYTRGFWEKDGGNQFSFAWGQSDLNASMDAEGDRGIGSIFFGGQGPFGNFTGAIVNAGADGFDISWPVVDGNTHRYVLLVLGESGAAPSFGGVGTFDALPATLAGAGAWVAPGFAGAGDFNAQPATMAGASSWVAPGFAGAGNLSAQAATIAGAGDWVAPQFSGAGALNAGAASLAGVGVWTSGNWVAVGSLIAQAAGLVGAGASVNLFDGVAALDAGAAQLAGAGAWAADQTHVGLGDLVAQAAALAGAASSVNLFAGAGSLTASAGTLRGIGFLDPVPDLGVLDGRVVTRPTLRGEVKTNVTR